MKAFISTAILCLTGMVINAQNSIALQTKGTTVFYQVLDSAITHALDGDTLYLSGGVFGVSGTLNKRLHLVGVGHHPDSTKSTSSTNLLSELKLGSGSARGSITGINMASNYISIQGSLDNYIISRCNLSISSSTNNVSNLLCIENVLKNIDINGNNNIFYNNIIQESGLRFGTSNTLKNNIFLGVYFLSYNGLINYSLFENNIFLNGSNDFTGNVYSNSFKNNLFLTNFNLNRNSNFGIGNLGNQPQSSVFINQSGNTFDYTHDYHINPDSPAKNAGTDGTDIGIYGGLFPWKEGSVPFNPHIQSLILDSKTDKDGNLNVKIKVQAQEH
jgi:hypothetical protein